jgi:hypothetical protein
MPTKDATLTVNDDAPRADDTPAWAHALISGMTDLTTRLDHLEQEAREAKARAPAFKPMQHPQAKKKTGGVYGNIDQQIAGSGWREVWDQGVRPSSILCDIHGEKIPDAFLDRMAPRFGPGDAVRIDPASARPGFPPGTTWGSLLAEKVPSNPDGVGTVNRVLWLTDEGQWKYTCTIPGLTAHRPDGFHDHELLPA